MITEQFLLFKATEAGELSHAQPTAYIFLWEQRRTMRVQISKLETNFTNLQGEMKMKRWGCPSGKLLRLLARMSEELATN